MRLASADDVLVAAGIANPPEATKKHAEAMLDISFPIVESLLETSLVAGARLDSFSPAKEYQTEFRLTNGFVAEDSVQVYCAPAAGNPYGSLKAEFLLPSSEYTVDLERGLLIVSSVPYFGSHTLVATYEYGFAESTSEPGTMVVTDQLKQIAINAALLSLNVLPSSPGNRKEKAVSFVAKNIYGHLSMALSPYRRPRLVVMYPTFSAAYD